MRLSQLSDRQIARSGFNRFEARALARAQDLFWSPTVGLSDGDARARDSVRVKPPRHSESVINERYVKVELQRRHRLCKVGAHARAAREVWNIRDFRSVPPVMLGADFGTPEPAIARVASVTRSADGLRVDIVFDAPPVFTEIVRTR